MKAIVVKPQVSGSMHMRDMPDPKMAPDQVAVRMLRVGLCGTDAEIDKGMYGTAPDGDEYLIVGHENFGVVEDVGKRVKGWKPGDLVVATVRRPCGACANCKAGENDMCRSGGYTERGIMRRHGYMAEYYVDSPQYLHRVPKAVRDVGVLLEPLSVVEKGIDHALLLQRRMRNWKPRLALVTGPGPIGLLGVAVAKALGAHPVILTGTRDNRLKIGLELGADHVINARTENVVEAVRKLNGGKGVDYVVECSGAPNAVNEAVRMVNRGGKVCLAAFPHEETPVDVAHIVRNNIYLFGIRGEGKSATHRAEAFMSQKRFDATKVHTHTFPLEDLPTAIKYARERIDDAIKVVVKTRGAVAQRVAAE
jgi:threonine dehydrogenase-like Zn-dependent dehydrogenase